ncbi:phospholipase D/nuclease [Trametopsis cervina]|nr:phospholipase D/nuclease [Trametopsis cervina]
MDGFDDDEIQRAIALSLQESAADSASGQAAALVKAEVAEVIEIDDDDDDPEYQAQLQRAMAESKASAPSPASTPPASGSSDSARAYATTVPPPSSVFLTDRAALERERLARQKRQRPDFEVTNNVIPKDELVDDMDIEDLSVRQTKRQRVSSSIPSARTNTSYCSEASTSARPHPAGDALFYDGELRQTANKHVEPMKDTRPLFRLSEILSPKSEVAFAIISAYVINFPWMYTFFDPKTPVIVVTQDQRGEETIKEVLPEWIKTTPFLRGGFGCMHMKFMLIFYKTGRLRVVISTANLIEHDWRDIENSVWVQDVPARVNPLAHDPRAEDFASAMTRVLRSVNVAPALITLMRNGHDLPLRRLEELREKWDFSRVTVKLIPSLAGKHEGWPSVIRNGHTALMKAIRDMNVETPQGKELILECQGSSIAAYSTQWTNEFYVSARGESAEKWLAKPRTQRAKLPYPPIKILFPTKRTVQQSVLGENGGGTMFCRRNQWEAAKFPRELFYDSRSKRGRVLMHSKMVIGTFRLSGLAAKVPGKAKSEQDGAATSDNCIGWAYVGSHNFTSSAWGTLSGSDFNPALNITNFELGIAFPLRDESHLASVACWERPPKKYALGSDEPWFQSESACFTEES